MSPPHLAHTEHGIRLMVQDKPTLLLPGELHNSSLSSPKYMSTVWPAMKAQHINTLLGSVTWEMIEPVEGAFDFSSLTQIILDARKHGIYLVLLWFGSYKNGISTYAPAWVKRDHKRFPRVRVWDAQRGGQRTIEMISPLCAEGARADARAFQRLMEHVREVDSEFGTVVMVQVENETGLLGDSRDRSPRAEEAFREGVPVDLLRHLAAHENLHPRFKERFGTRLPDPESLVDKSDKVHYSWASIFGAGTAADEAFMAYHISRYVGTVALAGKSAYNLPMYTNTWLNFDDASTLDLTGYPLVVGGGARPGIYPSGGPCPHVSDIWRYNATPAALDFLAPDLYFHDYERVCADYTFPAENPLFVPEQRRDAHGARRVWVAYATYGALGTSPFGVDTGADEIGREYKLLAQTSEYLLNSKPSQRMGFFFDELPESGSPKGKETWTRAFGNIEVIIERAFVFGKPGPGGGMVIQLGDESSYRFLVVGRGFQVRFRGLEDGVTFTGILEALEKEVDEQTGELVTLRVLNGDETRSGEFLIMPNDEPDYGGFPIAVTIPARTCIAEVEAYNLCEGY
ncbi:glycoside hydrolase superfamily [Aspergillus pseudoustus]|uniref:Glycoside hydrolase superfamily n=1 Tax=Aspergillus pseudoustus TaxID=1810923 RepID=A0ABR4IV61_9EURO